MSFVGVMVTASVPSTALPASLRSLDDLGPVPLEDAHSVMVFSRNGWIGARIGELAQLEGIRHLPTGDALAKVADAAGLDELIARLTGLLEGAARDPLRLPEGARELADDAELRRAVALAPPSLQDALAAFRDATARDADAENLETLMALLWCQLRLAEHARANGRIFICVRG